MRSIAGRCIGTALALVYLAFLVSVVGQVDIWQRLHAGAEQHHTSSGERRGHPPKTAIGRSGGANEPRRGSNGFGERVGALAHAAWQTARLPLAVLISIAAAILISRTLARQRRLATTRRWEIRLGREDLATPYQREKMFDAFYGQLVERWWTRFLLGQPSASLEVHQLADGTQCLTIAANEKQARILEGRLLATYPDVQLKPTDGSPLWGDRVIRLKKQRLFVERIQTVKDDEQALIESVVSTMAGMGSAATVQFVLTPAPRMAHSLSRSLLKSRERELTRVERRSPSDIGVDSVVEDKELKGALETQHRSLFFTEIRVASESWETAKALAGMLSESRSENVLIPRHMRLRRRLYGRRIWRAASNPLPSFLRGLLSSSELAALWSLPRQRVRSAQLPRAPTRRATAGPEIARDSALALMRDERGPVGLFPEDLKYGVGFMGGQGGGKTSGIARTIEIDAQDESAAMIVADPKHDLAEYALSLIPAHRTVWYMDLAHPEVGINPLRIDAESSAIADVVLQAMKEAHEPGAILSQSDEFLRNAALAICAAERQPTLWHMYELLSPRNRDYRLEVVARLEQLPGMDAVARYWGTTFPDRWMDSRTHMAGQLSAPLNKINRLLTTPSVDLALRHPFSLDLGHVIRNREILVVNGALGEVGEENAVVVLQMLLQLVHQAMKQQQRQPEEERVRVCLKVDEAHLVLTPSFATMLALHRAAGPLEVTAAWQYSAQVADRSVRSGLKSLLRSRSVFAMSEMSDAREQAEVAMEVYSDSIRPEREDRERMRFGPDDIVRLPPFTALNSWVAGGTRQSAFVAQTIPMRAATTNGLREHHLDRQRRSGAFCPEHLPAPIASHSSSGSGAEGEKSVLREPAASVEVTRNEHDHPTHPPAPSKPPLGWRVDSPFERKSADVVPAAAREEVESPAGTYLAVHHRKIAGIDWEPIAHDRDVAAVLQFRPRDGEILRALWRYELLLVSQIWQEWWPGNSLRSAQARLKQLAAAGWVQRFRLRESGQHEAGYALTRRGFLAGQRHAGEDGPFITVEAKWKGRRPVDHRTVQHLLQVNAWVLVFRRWVGDQVVDWIGEHEGRLEVPTKLKEGRRVAITEDDVGLERYERVRDVLGPFGRVWPDATLTIEAADGSHFDLMIELDRTKRPSRNFRKFRHYDAFITAWWRNVPRYRELKSPPRVVFVCASKDHALSFMDAADRQVTGRVARPGSPESSWPFPGRDHFLFAAEPDVHRGSLRAWKLESEPAEMRERIQHSPCLMSLADGGSV
jgi:hypothetical protein